MNQYLLEILRCPQSKKKLLIAEQKIIEKINKAIRAGSIRNIAKELINDTVKEALLEPENGIVYIIKEGIPQLIYEEGLRLKEIP